VRDASLEGRGLRGEVSHLFSRMLAHEVRARLAQGAAISAEDSGVAPAAVDSCHRHHDCQRREDDIDTLYALGWNEVADPAAPSW
jgi:hypothetical protein